MKLTQNSEAWLKWRMEGLGASDIPVILGKSKFKTRLQLWQEKLNYLENGTLPKEDDNTYIQDKGHLIEQGARTMYEFETGLTFPPVTFEHSDFPFCKCSLDGWNKELMHAWECKYMGREDFERLRNNNLAIKERIPPQYYDQIMHQFFVSDALAVRLTGVNDTIIQGRKLNFTLIIERDKEVNDYIIKTMCPQIFEFWKSLKEKKKPDPEKFDSVAIESPRLNKLADDYNEKKKKLKRVEEDLNKIKDKIFNHSLRKHENMVSETGILMQEISGRITTDYRAAFEAFIGWINHVKTASPGEIANAVIDFPETPNLEKYQKVGKPQFRITIPKELKPKIEKVKPHQIEVPEIDAEIKEVTDKIRPEIIPAKIQTQEWDKMNARQRKVEVEANNFKSPKTKRKFRNWDRLTRPERIHLLKNKIMAEKDEMAKKPFKRMVEKMQMLQKELYPN